ncbi:MAG: hypothetical protein U9R37_02965 [Campylobacterota bacterium]|nr:hypothetical protein [Campylobacterota bacterium]
MKDLNNEDINDNLTQKDIVQLLLHNAQHMVTREELKSDIKELKDDIKQDILKSDNNTSKVETNLEAKISKVETSLEAKISKLEINLKQDMYNLETNLKQDMSKLEDKITKVDEKFDKIQWLIIATILTVLLKDYIFALIQTTPAP